jgi:hypothetical protein
MDMEPLVYLSGAVTTSLCAVLLLLGYRRSRTRLLLWSGLCFAVLALSNTIVFFDRVIVPEVDLYLWRIGSAVVAMTLLLFGLIWEER